MGLATFFPQADSEPPAFRVDILDPHGQRRADSRERIHHQRKRRAIAEPYLRAGIETIKQLASFFRLQHRGLALCALRASGRAPKPPD